MKLYFINIFLFALCLGNPLFSQQSKIDSLEIELTLVEDEKKVDILIDLSDLSFYISTPKGIKYAEEAIELANSINYKKGLASAYGSLGYGFIGDDTEKAKEYTRKALEIRKAIKDKIGESRSLNVLGLIYYFSGEYLISIEYHINSIKLKEEIGDKKLLATSYNNIALVYMTVENFDKALEYLNKALKVRISSNNLRGVGIIKSNIGDIYLRTGEYEKAYKFLDESLKLNKEIGSTKAEANSLNSIASLFKNKKEYDKAFEYYSSSVKLYKDLGMKNGIANAENGLADLYKIRHDYKAAIKHAEIALTYAREINSLLNIKNATNTLSFCYEKEGNYRIAYDYLELNKNTQDSLQDGRKLKKIGKIELEHKIENMRLEQERELSKQKSFIQFLVLTLIFGGAILLLVIFYSRSKKAANIKLNELNSKLKKKDLAKDRFLSIVAHDLRGPYQSNLGISEYLMKELNSLSKEEIESSVANLNSTLKKQYELLDNLLKWGTLQEGNIEFNKELFSLKVSVNDIFELLELTAKKKEIVLVNNISDDQVVNADKNMLYLLLRNLITNSIKFSYNKTSVEVNSVKNAGGIQITVLDNGVGIEEKILENLFKVDIHYTAKGTNQEEGSGLGLLLCKEIIEKHGGSIWAESEVDKGSQFIFTLPT